MRRNGRWYWVVTIGLIGFGFLSILSIGWLFVIAGVVMVVAGVTGWASTHPSVFWSVVAAIAAFVVGYLAVAPWSCRSEVTSGDGTAGITECASVVGVRYEGAADFNPPLWPGAVAGLVAASVVGPATRAVMARRPSR